MSAAMEAAIEGIPSAGFSLCNHNFDADFSIARQVAAAITERMLASKLPPHTLLNVNIPKVTASEFKGLKFCRQAYAKWQEEFDERVDPRGQKYYWMTGRFVNMDSGVDTDSDAIAAGYASIVPVKFDLTDHAMRTQLAADWQDLDWQGNEKADR